MTNEEKMARDIQKLSAKIHAAFAGKRLNVCMGALASMFAAVGHALSDEEFEQAIKMFGDGVLQIRGEMKTKREDEVAGLPL